MTTQSTSLLLYFFQKEAPSIMEKRRTGLCLGIDIGSTACKSVVIKDGTTIVSTAIVPLGTGTIGVSQVFEQVLAPLNVTREDLDCIYATGYGRFSFKEADNQKSEISCHAKGIPFLLPDIHTIIDIGGQDIKVMKLNANGKLSNFVMNDKCAAGTGRFLDVMARVLNVRTEDLGPLSDGATNEVSISSTCTVFAESEVISQLANEVRIEDLIAGIHTSVAKRVASLAFRNGIEPKVAMSGGVALNHGLVRALSRELKMEISVHPQCQLAGAIGAALFAWEDVCSEDDED